MGPVEVIAVDSKKITCDGTNHKPADASSHPLVYLNMGEKDNVVCPYCSKYFKISRGTGHAPLCRDPQKPANIFHSEQKIQNS